MAGRGIDTVCYRKGDGIRVEWRGFPLPEAATRGAEMGGVEDAATGVCVV